MHSQPAQPPVTGGGGTSSTPLPIQQLPQEGAQDFVARFLVAGVLNHTHVHYLYPHLLPEEVTSVVASPGSPECKTDASKVDFPLSEGDTDSTDRETGTLLSPPQVEEGERPRNSLLPSYP